MCRKFFSEIMETFNVFTKYLTNFGDFARILFNEIEKRNIRQKLKGKLEIIVRH